jgi:transposase
MEDQVTYPIVAAMLGAPKVRTVRGFSANIPPKANRKDAICFSKLLYKARNLIEYFFNKIKHYHRVTTRYDKTTENFLAALKLVAVRIWLRDSESTS